MDPRLAQISLQVGLVILLRVTEFHHAGDHALGAGLLAHFGQHFASRLSQLVDQAASVPGIPLEGQALEGAAPLFRGVCAVLAGFLGQIVGHHSQLIFLQDIQHLLRFTENARQNDFISCPMVCG